MQARGDWAHDPSPIVNLVAPPCALTHSKAWHLTDPRRFLFLQGPHGPWFHQLARQIRVAGGQVWRVGFNLGDLVF